MRKPYLLLLSTFIFAGLMAKPPIGFCEHPDGMYYKVIKQSLDSLHPSYGDYIYMHLIKHHPEKKEVFNTHIFNSREGVEFALEKPAKVPDVTQIFTFMSAGDSAVVKIPASSVDTNGSKNKFYTYYLKLISFQSKTIYESEKAIALNTQRAIDDVLIVNFLQTRSLQNATRDSTGVVYQKSITTDSPFFQTGDTVKMQYKGTLVNGFEFDNSYYRNEPLKFVAGKKQVIDGLDIAMSFFRRGESGIIIIPSYLGYASREVGKIPPNSVLVFEIEILP